MQSVNFLRHRISYRLSIYLIEFIMGKKKARIWKILFKLGANSCALFQTPAILPSYTHLSSKCSVRGKKERKLYAYVTRRHHVDILTWKLHRYDHIFIALVADFQTDITNTRLWWSPWVEYLWKHHVVAYGLFSRGAKGFGLTFTLKLLHVVHWWRLDDLRRIPL